VKTHYFSTMGRGFSSRKRVEENEEVEEVGENRAAKKIRFSWFLTC
jgi:hypothetical protein